MRKQRAQALFDNEEHLKGNFSVFKRKGNGWAKRSYTIDSTGTCEYTKNNKTGKLILGDTISVHYGNVNGEDTVNIVTKNESGEGTYTETIRLTNQDTFFLHLTTVYELLEKPDWLKQLRTAREQLEKRKAMRDRTARRRALASNTFQDDTRVRYKGKTLYVQRDNGNGTYDLYTGSGEDDAADVPKSKLALAKETDQDYVSRRRLGWKPSDDIRCRQEGFHHSHNRESIRYED